jgi:hypothetical protein
MVFRIVIMDHSLLLSLTNFSEVNSFSPDIRKFLNISFLVFENKKD